MRAFAALFAICAACAVTAPAASAEYSFEGTFAGTGPGPGGSGSEDGQLSDPGHSAVNPATGDLYVADTGNDRIEVFSPTASGLEYDSQAPFTDPTGLAIDPASGAVYVAGPSGITKLDAGLAPVDGWTDPGVTGAIAVDPSTGDLLVADRAANLIRRYEADGTAAGSFAAEGPIGVAADSSGQIFVVTSAGDIYSCFGSAVVRFAADGTELGTLAGLEAPGTVAVDPDDDSLAVATRVNQYNCGAQRPLLVLFDSASVQTETIELPDDTLYATVPGLALAGGDSLRLYAITKSPFDDFFGATKGFVYEKIVPGPPSVIGTSVSPTQTEATFRATIDRGNAATTYRFEYGATAAYGQSTSEKTVGAGKEAVEVSATAFGLSPDTTYHYRVVIENSEGEAQGPDRTFTTLPAAEGPDGCPNASLRAAQGSSFLGECRAYERVSPQAKNGNDIIRAVAQAAVDGEGLAYTAAGAFGDAESSSIDSRYAAFRGPDGWTTHGVMPPFQNNFLSVESVFQFTPNLDHAVATAQSALVPGAVSGAINIYRRDVLAGQFTLLSPRPNGSKTNIFPGLGSAELDTYVFTSEEPLAAGDPPPPLGQGYDLYESRLEGGVAQLRLVKAGANLGSGVVTKNAVSADGSRIFYTSPGNQSVLPSGQLYMSDEGSEVEISRSQLPTPEAEHRPAVFLGATPDGSKVLFASTERLNEESNADGGPLSGTDFGDLYLYDVASEVLTDLSASAPSGGQTTGLLGFADDLSRVYFVDVSALAAGATDGEPNLYMWSQAAGVEFLATLSPGDTGSWELPSKTRQARVSADGSGVVFQSRAEIAGYDPAGNAAIYVYRVGDGLTCVSCPAGRPTDSDGQLVETLAGGSAPNHEARSISDDGELAFFTTGDQLVPRDTNGRRDVYSWSAATGRTSLISSGQGEGDSFFLDASPDGDNAFFVTRQQLVGWDTDSLMDAYVARVGGGFPEPAASAPPCRDEGCKPPQSPPPAVTPPGSSSLVGPGNRKPPRRKCGKHHKKKKKHGKKATKNRCKGKGGRS